MYISEGQWEQVYILIMYVDNILLATNDLGVLSETKKFLSNKFEMKDMLKLEEASSLPRLDVCLMKKMAWVL